MIRKPMYELIFYEDQLKKIEYCGRVCYKSEEKITENSYKSFIKQRVQDGHLSILEHGFESFVISGLTLTAVREFYNALLCEPYLKVDKYGNKKLICSGNLRAWYEYLTADTTNNPHIKQFIFNYFVYKYPLLFDKFKEILYRDLLSEDRIMPFFKSLDEFSIPKDIIDNHIYITIKFWINRKMSHQLVRHRKMSFLQESTRYVDYQGKDIDFVFDETVLPKSKRKDFLKVIKHFNDYINDMYSGVKRGLNLQKQFASLVLPQIVKTELIISGYKKDWEHLIKERTKNSVYPELKVLMEKIAKRFNENF